MTANRVQPRLPAAPPASSAAVAASMRGNRSSKTSPEAVLARAFEEAGISGYVPDAKGLPGSPDVAFPRKHLAVFVHGCYWHRCPHCRPLFPHSDTEYCHAKFERNRRRDARVRVQLRVLGWKTSVLWECQVKSHPQRAAARVARRLEGLGG